MEVENHYFRGKVSKSGVRLNLLHCLKPVSFLSTPSNYTPKPAVCLLTEFHESGNHPDLIVVMFCIQTCPILILKVFKSSRMLLLEFKVNLGNFETHYTSPSTAFLVI